MKSKNRICCVEQLIQSQTAIMSYILYDDFHRILLITLLSAKGLKLNEQQRLA
jgi:hypothetical protein